MRCTCLGSMKSLRKGMWWGCWLTAKGTQRGHASGAKSIACSKRLILKSVGGKINCLLPPFTAVNVIAHLTTDATHRRRPLIIFWLSMQMLWKTLTVFLKNYFVPEQFYWHRTTWSYFFMILYIGISVLCYMRLNLFLKFLQKLLCPLRFESWSSLQNQNRLGRGIMPDRFLLLIYIFN